MLESCLKINQNVKKIYIMSINKTRNAGKSHQPRQTGAARPWTSWDDPGKIWKTIFNKWLVKHYTWFLTNSLQACLNDPTEHSNNTLSATYDRFCSEKNRSIVSWCENDLSCLFDSPHTTRILCTPESHLITRRLR